MNVKLQSFTELENINNSVFIPSNFELLNIQKESESSEYLAHRFQLKGKNVVFRKAKITPTKVGQFVTCWKRNDAGITVPFEYEDKFDFFIIYTESETKKGFFVFPKDVLLNKKIIFGEKSSGKRGFRVYPPWIMGLNKQAEQTQGWQAKYFVDMTIENQIGLEMTKRIFQY